MKPKPRWMKSVIDTAKAEAASAPRSRSAKRLHTVPDKPREPIKA